uniref:Uncharacterized protein n=1 Tax=Parastrongyloides trichosuri TaxID=131310 RepID=A0A0N5A0T3_PARTI
MSKHIFLFVFLIYFFIEQLNIHAQLSCSTGSTVCIIGFTYCNKAPFAGVEVYLREISGHALLDALEQTFAAIAGSKSTDTGQFTLNVKNPRGYNASRLVLYFYHKCNLQNGFGYRYHAEHLSSKCIDKDKKLKNRCIMSKIELNGTKDTIDVVTESTDSNIIVKTYTKSMQTSKK